MAEVAYVPAIVFQGLSDAVAIELGLLENLHRRDLTIIEEAEALQLLIDRFGRGPSGRGGDHVIIIGEVETFETFEGEPLVFHSGSYRVVTRHPELDPA